MKGMNALWKHCGLGINLAMEAFVDEFGKCLAFIVVETL